MRLYSANVIQLNRKFALTALILLIASLSCVAASDTQAYSVETVPNVRLSDTKLHVSDPTALLSAQARDTINTLFTQLESETGIEVAVVMLPSIGEANAFDFAHRLFRSWGVGKKGSNNGLLILYVEDQHTIHFVTGYGLEGTLTDALCKRIQSRYMVPAFKRGDKDTGMVMGAKAVCSTLTGTMQASDKEETDPMRYLPILIFSVIILILFMTGAINHHRRCPRCGKRALRVRSIDHYTMNGRNYRKEVSVCDKCGHVDVRDIDETHHDNTGTGSFITGMLLGSMLGGGRGSHGGGFSGGSFGGGNSGGGGAGSSW